MRWRGHLSWLPVGAMVGTFEQSMVTASAVPDLRESRDLPNSARSDDPAVEREREFTEASHAMKYIKLRR